MPTNASTVGPVQFPLDATVADTPLRDPTATVLLQLAAHWLNFGMSAKLLSMQPTKSEAIPVDKDGVPENLGEFDPGTTFVRRELPHLYCWCQKSVSEQWTMVQWLRSSEYHMRFYFQPLTMPQGRGARSGLLPNLDRLLHRMADEKRHRTFPSAAVALELAKVGVTVDLGASIERPLDVREIKLLRTIYGTTWESPGQGSTAEGITRAVGQDTDGGVQRGFPTLHCVWGVKEFVNGDQLDGVQDETPDLNLLIRATTGEGEGHIDIMNRNLQAPDGTALSQKDEFD